MEVRRSEGGDHLDAQGVADQGHQGGQEEAEGGHDQGNQRFVCEEHNHTYLL